MLANPVRHFPVKTPWALKKLFPSYLWEVPNSPKTLYLTFDDGPTPEVTPWVLDILDHYSAKATFFCLGKNVSMYPSLFQEMMDRGHTTGNHTQNHVKGWKTSVGEYLIDVERAAAVISSRLFRPPYGQITPRQGRTLRKNGYLIVMWDVISFDWDKEITEEKCLQNVLKHTVGGSIIVFHDSKKAQRNMQYALPHVLEYFCELGFHFKGL